ncbi:MAG: tRNA uridine-5-carboxymethylaminomethyl(34) synthesis GTPase MnmE [Bacilli bacterium]|nr:tRNA uridine-5-carboxymethylaminomethyl(34) synthesis GTPase MnmE [Bacilli bacterium]
MNDTIVAVSTSHLIGAISIVRLSGDEAISIVNKTFKGKNLEKVPTHTINYGHIYDGADLIDEVMVTIMRAPKTYTKEDVVEINCHGGQYVTQRILELMIKNGARMAEAGEFTKRAFLNGRIDLTQAEAVMDVIDAKTKESLKLANVALRGDVKKKIEALRSKLVTCIAKIEVNIDYPEYEDEEQITQEILIPILNDTKKDIEELLEKSEVSEIIKDGINTAIIGKPNVGKSSLLNGLLRERKAIVTDIAGTTRDIVEGKVNIGGIVLNLIDTAGIHATSDVIEQIGVKKSIDELNKADLIILVFDNSQELSNDDEALLEQTKDRNRIVIVNKSDLESKIDLSKFEDYVLMSALDEEDICSLEKKIREMYSLNDLNNIDATYIGNARQKGKLFESLKSINDALESANSGQVVDIINVDITEAYTALGDIIGENSSDTLVSELFSKFCLGK